MATPFKSQPEKFSNQLDYLIVQYVFGFYVIILHYAILCDCLIQWYPTWALEFTI